ncbi:MAG TPA: hypothetical protein VNN07_18790 [Candidatus Tectomicrobia bacterium]|nr:hypothetical protein [Candidatus Tectomicrobia bacterium]
MSLATGHVNMQLTDDDPPGDPALALRTLLDLGLKYTHCRPACLEVADGALGESTVPDALEAPGMTVERMRSFAAAARAFHEAAPWRYLTDEDLIHVEAPDVGPGLRHVTVLGAAGQSFGLGSSTVRAPSRRCRRRMSRSPIICRARAAGGA